jgi:glucokinase
MILAGDVGGTKTLIGLFEVYKRRPVPVDVRTFQTTAYSGLPAIITEFLAKQTMRPDVTGAAFGVAGPVINQTAQMTNVPWAVDAAELARIFHLPRVRLLNDLESMAHGLPVLLPDELKTLQAGKPALVRHSSIRSATLTSRSRARADTRTSRRDRNARWRSHGFCASATGGQRSSMCCRALAC